MGPKAIAVALLVGLTVVTQAQTRTPEKFQPSLDAAAKRQRLKLPPPTTPPDVKSTLYKMADALGMLRGTEESDSLITMHWWATGTMNSGGRPCTLTSYRGSVRFNIPGMRVDYTCAGPDGKPGRRNVNVVAGAFAWNETAPGVGATPAMDAVHERLLQIWTLPHGIVKAATAAGTNTKVTLEGGVVYVSFPLPAPLTGTAKAALNTTDAVELTMSNGDTYQLTNSIDRVETRMGTIVTETAFSEYGDWNEADYKSDVWFPKRIVQKRGGVTILDLTIEKTNTYNPYVVMPVPDGLKQPAPKQSAAAR